MTEFLDLMPIKAMADTGRLLELSEEIPAMIAEIERLREALFEISMAPCDCGGACAACLARKALGVGT